MERCSFWRKAFLRLTLACGVACALGLGAAARAGFISEVYLAGAGSTHPNAVELSGISGDAVDLIVVSALPGYYGEVLQVVHVPVVSDVVIISDDVWGSGAWGPTNGEQVMQLGGLEAQGDPDDFAFSWAWSLLVYDRATQVQANSLDLFTNALQQARLGDAVLLDQLTISVAGMPVDRAVLGNVLSLSRGQALSRQVDGRGTQETLAGVPTAEGYLLDGVSPYRLTPGLRNLPLPTGHMPEPTSAALLAGLAGLVLRRRAGHRG